MRNENTACLDGDVPRFDWIFPFSKLEGFLHPEFLGLKDAPPNGYSVLMVGCGNSAMAEEMYDNTCYKQIHNIDNRPEVIDFMTTNCIGRPGITWEVVDACKDDWGMSRQYNLVIDKCTTDCIIISDANWSHMLLNILDSLSKEGSYMLISYQSELMLQLLSVPSLHLPPPVLHPTSEPNRSAIIVRKFAPDLGKRDLSTVMEEQRAVLDVWNGHLLTPASQDALRCKLCTKLLELKAAHQLDSDALPLDALPLDDALPLNEAYAIMFDKELRNEYSLHLFGEDLQATAPSVCERNPPSITVDEALRFMCDNEF
jgi:hypothetical protein